MMDKKERMIKILECLQEKQMLELSDLMDKFAISKDTARRDILNLVEHGYAEKIRGGITLPKIKERIENYEERLIKHSLAKQKIARLATQYMKDNQVIWLDVSTTVQLLAEHVQAPQLLFVTNSLDNALTFSKYNYEVFLLGGFFQKDSHLLKGSVTFSQIDSFHFDIAFLGASGMDEQSLFYSEIDDISFHEMIINNSDITCLLVDHTKFHNQGNFKMSLEGIDYVITDATIPESIRNSLEHKGIKWTIGE